MLRSVGASIVAVAVMAFAVQAHAGCGNCESKKAKDASAATCPASGCNAEACTVEACSAAKCDSNKDCPITAAMERLPKITYTVGEKETCCPKEAAKLAEAADTHFHFCVAGKEFDKESKAQAALIEATERFVANFAEPKKCPKSGQLTLAGKGQSCEKSASRLAKSMKDAMAKVKLTYVVGEEECGCPMKAAKLAKETGKEKQYAVGYQTTCCEKTARLALARAKYRAAVEALVKAQSEGSASTQASGS